MREPKVYWKNSHKCFYVNIGGKPHRLDPDETKAAEMHETLLATKGVIKPSYVVALLLEQFLEHHKLSSKPFTYHFYQVVLNSFTHFIGPKLKVKDLKSHHVRRPIPERADNVKGLLARLLHTVSTKALGRLFCCSYIS
jgi:hypothetical protein